jgi:tRNA pseudouridine38-40 synthase
LRVRLVVAYDGAPFHGMARNEGVATVAGSLEAGLARVLGAPVVLTVAGRTDRGVHAWGQVVSFDDPTGRLDADRLRRSLNGLCAPSIVVRSVEAVPDDFDARFSARWRRYRYRILNRDVPDPFSGHLVWWVPEQLDLDAMALAASVVVGEHDFAAFCRRPKPMPGAAPASMVRRVHDASWTRHDGDEVCFEITASSFCHQMVRSLVGAMVTIGRGRLEPAAMAAILDERDRDRCPDVAPPQGLCLWEVGYDDGPGGADAVGLPRSGTDR